MVYPVFDVDTFTDEIGKIWGIGGNATLTGTPITGA